MDALEFTIDTKAAGVGRIASARPRRRDPGPQIQLPVPYRVGDRFIDACPVQRVVLKSLRPPERHQANLGDTKVRLGLTVDIDNQYAKAIGLALRSRQNLDDIDTGVRSGDPAVARKQTRNCARRLHNGNGDGVGGILSLAPTTQRSQAVPIPEHPWALSWRTTGSWPMVLVNPWTPAHSAPKVP
jgi:hypothetical protein